MGFRQWVTKNASKTAEAVVIQTKEALQNKAVKRMTANGNIYAAVGKLLAVGLVAIVTIKELFGRKETVLGEEKPAQPQMITINNYIGKEKIEHVEDHDFRKG